MEKELEYLPLLHCWVLLRFLETQKRLRARDIGKGMSTPLIRLHENMFLFRDRETPQAEWRYQLSTLGAIIARKVLAEIKNFPGAV